MTLKDPTIREQEFITIIGTDIAQINREFQAQGLSDRDYAIVNRVGQHRFTWAGGDGSQPMFDGKSYVAATFARHK
jgi:hypothetical protein